MRRLASLFCVLTVLSIVTTASAEPEWLTLPPTPMLPKAERSGYAQVNRIQIWYAVFGRGEPVILLHGGLANSNYWGNQVPALAMHYRVIVMDSRGHGRSARDEQAFSYDLNGLRCDRPDGLPENPQGGDRRLERWGDFGPGYRYPSSRASDQTLRLRRQFRSERRKGRHSKRRV